jgi:catechol 2,3-dioxygenase-like lactoylglutathione lyase family enzyme
MLSSAQLIGFVPATNLDRSRAYYADVLGLELQEAGPVACVFRSGPTMLRVIEVDGLRPQPFTVLGWEVEDIDREIDQLMAHGVAFAVYDGLRQDSLGVWTSPNDDRVAWFTDPDGNTLSLTQFARTEN